MFETVSGWMIEFVAALQQWIFEGFVQPLLFAVGLMRWQEDAFDATEWFVIGVLEVGLLALLLGGAQRLWPAEPMTDRSAVRTDILYTLLHRLGAIPVAVFFLVTPLFDALEAWLRLAGFSRLNLETLLPWLDGRPLMAFLAYLIVLDAADYLIHRAQHTWRWWWTLHAVHHSQRQMTFWSDNRNHLLDDLIRDGLLALLAIAIGVAPGQFVALVVVSRVLQSLQHANLRWRFGAVGERLLVSPSFHRRHHAIGVGHEGRRHGCNFAVLFPIWDVLGGTADFRPGWVPTGIRDQLEGRDYGRGFWSQQWLALRRWAGRA
ncbi:sterol desaturase family protein [Zeimonas arvi]|uniref:Sterol desaturase family protein n=1 Tax=Zeimonas arvi TaxID=2498847 RepID=A0A5C8NRT4_9BURK|nr:sterol desaturase family protein [Zeimonas arvi]TXL63535.1 sterol desaturase family protein [Zeimonas arvi]